MSSAQLPQCPLHHEPALGPCARCGTFFCSRCGTREGLCPECQQRSPSVWRIASGYGSSQLFRRAVAFWVDAVPAAGVLGLVHTGLSSLWPGLPQWTAWAWFLGYYLVFEARFGATPGKWLLGLRVVDELGRPPGWSRAARRTLLRFVEANALLCGGLLALLCAARSPVQQRLGDRWAGTYVLLAGDVPPRDRR